MIVLSRNVGYQAFNGQVKFEHRNGKYTEPLVVPYERFWRDGKPNFEIEEMLKRKFGISKEEARYLVSYVRGNVPGIRFQK